MSSAQEKECMFKCGKILVFDPNLPSPPYVEKGTNIHHTFQRCFEVHPNPEEAKKHFTEYHDNKRRRDLNNQH